MKKFRVFEVTRSLFGEIDHPAPMGDVVRTAQSFDWGVKTHSSSITLEQARTLRREFRQRMAPRSVRRQAWRDRGSRFTWSEFSLA